MVSSLVDWMDGVWTCVVIHSQWIRMYLHKTLMNEQIFDKIAN